MNGWMEKFFGAIRRWTKRRSAPERSAQEESRRGVRFVNIYSEFILAFLVFVSIGLTFMSQIFVNSDASRALSVNTIKTEGVDLEVYEDQLTHGTLTLKLSGTEAFDQVGVYLNGDYYGNFSSDTLTFDVRSNTLVEIDGRNLKQPFTVSVAGVTDNVVLQEGRMSAEVKQGICFLTRVFLRETGKAASE